MLVIWPQLGHIRRFRSHAHMPKMLDSDSHGPRLKMKPYLFAAFLLLFAVPSWSQTLTLTATHLTMEQGGQVPPLVWTESTYPKTCTGYPSLSTTATSSSAVGMYAISISAGTFACTGYTIMYVGNNLVVIAQDGNGAQINNSVTYPPAFTGGPSTNPAINVTSNSIANLVGDGVTDNTKALNALLSYHSAGNCGEQPIYETYLYFPPGVYLTSGQINPCGNYWTFFGSGPQSSVIRLAPNSAAFNTGTNTQWFNPTSVNGNDNFGEFVYNMGFDVGYGNPNAIPFTTEQNNAGAERNVIIWSEDGNCPYAFNLSQGYPGPALSKNLAIYGCVNAVYSNQIEYSWTFDQITTEGQTGTVINSGPLKMAIQHWLSDNSSKALAVAQNGGVSVIDSELLNGGGSMTGITNAPGGSVFARNVTVTGYTPAEVDTGTGTPVVYNGNLTQNWTGTAQSLFNSGQTPSSLRLPEEETPLPTDDPTQNHWTTLGSTQSNWCAQITGSPSATVYAPPGQYTGSGTSICSIPDTVNHIDFYGAVGMNDNYQFTFTVDGSSPTPLVIDGCFWLVCTITHTGSRTVVVDDAYLNTYNGAVGAGNVFLEDVATNGPASQSIIFQPGQSIWARQLNLENRTSVNFICNTCNIWILGYKTESSQPSLAGALTLANNAKAEIFTTFLYPLAAAGSGTSSMNLSNSEFFSAPTFSYVNVNGYNWQYWIQEQNGTVTKTLASPSQNSGNYLLNMYYSFAATSLPAPPTNLSIIAR
jgi:hypothetical protein